MSTPPHLQVASTLAGEHQLTCLWSQLLPGLRFCSAAGSHSVARLSTSCHMPALLIALQQLFKILIPVLRPTILATHSHQAPSCQPEGFCTCSPHTDKRGFPTLLEVFPEMSPCWCSLSESLNNTLTHLPGFFSSLQMFTH